MTNRSPYFLEECSSDCSVVHFPLIVFLCLYEPSSHQKDRAVYLSSLYSLSQESRFFSLLFCGTIHHPHSNQVQSMPSKNGYSARFTQ